MAFEGLICPNCSGELNEEQIKKGNLKCPHCKVNIKQKKYLAFLEYLMMNGIIEDIDFFDKTLYGDEIKSKSETEQELMDETNPNDYEDKSFRMKYIDDNPELAEEQNKDQGIKAFKKLTSAEDEEDWQEYNKRNEKRKKK